MIDQEPRELVVVDQLPLALDLSSRFHLAWKGSNRILDLVKLPRWRCRRRFYIIRRRDRRLTNGEEILLGISATGII